MISDVSTEINMIVLHWNLEYWSFYFNLIKSHSSTSNLSRQVGTVNPWQVNSSGPSIKREREELDIKMGKGFGSASGCKFSSSGQQQSISSSSGDNNSGIFVSMGFTWSGSLLVCLSPNSHLNVYKIHPNIDASKHNFDGIFIR
jgi:hypothetical protein